MKDDHAPDEHRLHALVDGRLPAEDAERLRGELQSDEALRNRHQAWQAQREQLRGLHRDVLQAPIPPSLAQAARQVGREARRLARWQRWGGLAASFTLAFLLGWLAHGQWPGSSASVARAPRVQEFGRQALHAHAVYSPEVRHPVEVAASEQDHLVQWLSRRLGRPLKVPDLAAQGYELVGGRLLPGEPGVRAQFMFQNPRGDRVTLYLGALDAARPGASRASETAFRFASEDGASTFYWVDQGFGYALAGRLSRRELLQLAESVYRQL